MKYVIKRNADETAAKSGIAPVESGTIDMNAGNGDVQSEQAEPAALNKSGEVTGKTAKPKYRPQRSAKGKPRIAPDEPGTLYEDKSKRTANARHFVRNDGTVRAVFSPEPVNYYDEESGEYKEIDNSLEDNGSEIVNKANSFKVRFDKSHRGGKVFDLEKGKAKVSVSFDKFADNSCGCEMCGDTNGIIFKHADGITDIEYLVEADHVKENIIINGRADSYEYGFKLNIENLTAQPAADGRSIELKNTATGEVEFVIPAPFMYDAEGIYSDDVYYEINDDSYGVLNIKVVADNEFINTCDRKFPVVIDPQIFVYGSEVFYSTCSVNTLKNPGIWKNNGEKGKIYSYSNAITDEIVRTVLLIKKSDMNLENSKVVDVKLNLYPTSISNSGYCYIGGKKYYIAQNKNIVIDILDAYNQPELFPGLGFSIAIVCADVYVVEHVYFETSGVNAPTIEIYYIANESQGFVKQNFTLAEVVKSNLNLNTGDLVSEFADINLDGSFPFAVSHVFKKGKNATNFGNNWRLNTNQELIKNDNNTLDSNFIFTDEQGSKHSFKESFYYLNSDNIKQYISDKNQITIGLDGSLTYAGNKVTKEQKTDSGLRVIDKAEGFINANLLEQRQEEQIKLEEYTESYKAALNDCVIMNITNGTIISELKNYFYDDKLSTANFNRFLSNLSSSNLMILQKAESIQYISNYYTSIETSASANTKSIAEKQMSFVKDKANVNLTSIKKIFKEYINKEYELKILKLHLPVNYLIDENNIVRAFNENGALVAMADSYENSIIIQYDEDGKIINITDNEQKQIIFNYNVAKQLSSVINDRGKKINYEYDKLSGDLKTVTFADGSTLDFTYNGGNITSVKSSDEIKTDILYDGGKPKQIKTSSTVSKITKEGNIPEVKIIETNGIIYGTNQTTITDDKGAEHTYMFNADGRLTQYRKIINGIEYEKTTYDYVRESHSNTSTQIYGAVDTVTESTTLNQYNKPIRKETGWEKLSATSQVKLITVYAYDNDQRLISERTEKQTRISGTVYPKYSCAKYYYNINGNLVRTESYVEGEELTSGVNITENVYDKKGRQTKTVSWNSLDSSAKFYTEAEYAENGQTATDIDESGENKTAYEYIDSTNIVRTKVSPDGGVTAYGRDAHTDMVTSMTASTEDGEANCNNTIYKCGVPVEIKSGANTYNYEYDEKRRVTAVRLNSDSENLITYEYVDDMNGERIDSRVTATMHNNQPVTVITEKDKRGNILCVEYGNSMYQRYDYNTMGAPVNLFDGVTGEITMNTFDNELNRLTKSERIDSSHYPVLTEKYNYNAYGQMAQTEITGSVTHTYSYEYKYDHARSLNYMTMPGGIKLTPKADVYGRNEEKVYSVNNKNILGQYTYYKKVGDHATNLVSSIRYGQRKNGQYVIGDGLKYIYDKNGNITEIHENGAMTARYAYDKLNRLTREDNRKLGKTWLYSYDNNGNILSKRECHYSLSANEEVPVIMERKYLYDGSNGDRLAGYEYTQQSAHVPALCGDSFCGDVYCGTSGSVATTMFSYDKLGNPLTYKGVALVWEKGRQLKSYNGLAFGYDGYGRRISKGVEMNTVSYVYDNRGNLVKQYSLGHFLEYIYDNTGIAALKYNGAYYLYRKNLQGDVTHIYDLDGNIEACYTYDAWGSCKVHNPDGSMNADVGFIGNVNPIRYRGYYWDSETGLYSLTSRYYDPEVGRFISPDSIDYLDPETINGLNLYAYAGNNPVMNIDPDGHFFFSFLIGLAVSSLVMWGLGQAFGSQIAGGIGSIVNGGGAIWTGIGLLAFGPIGIALGIGLIAVGAVTAAFGVNEIVAGATGNNAIRDWMGGGLYDGLNMGFNIASGVGQIAGNVGMRIASNNILNNLVRNPTDIQNYKLWQIKTYGRYTSQFNVGTMQKGNHAGQGYTLTHISGKGGGYIQYHPGNSTWHTLKNPYWKISSNYVQGKTWYDIILGIFFKP